MAAELGGYEFRWQAREGLLYMGSECTGRGISSRCASQSARHRDVRKFENCLNHAENAAFLVTVPSWPTQLSGQSPETFNPCPLSFFAAIRWCYPRAKEASTALRHSSPAPMSSRSYGRCSPRPHPGFVSRDSGPCDRGARLDCCGSVAHPRRRAQSQDSPLIPTEIVADRFGPEREGLS